MKIDFSLLHKFKFDNTYIVLDINSGIVHSLSPEAWDFLTAWEEYGGNAARAVSMLKKTYDSLELQEIQSEMEELAEQGFLFNSDLSADDYRAGENSVIKALCLHVAHDCNLRCRYCFAGTGSFGGERGLMDVETGKRALDFLMQVSGPRKHLEVDYFGGEPLLNYSVVQELIRYGKEVAHSSGKFLKQTLTTNAVLLDEEKTAFFEREGVCLILSIDGRPAVHDRMRPFPGRRGSYDVVSRAIRKFNESQRSNTYYVRGTYTHFNTDFCDDVLHLVDQGFTRLSLEPVVAASDKDYALTADDLPVLFGQYEKLTRAWLKYDDEGKPFEFFHFNISLDKGPCLIRRLSGCGAGYQYLAVSPAGNLYPCHQFVGQNEFIMGHVSTGIADRRLMQQFASAHVLNKEPCGKCWARFFCGGGCHANAYNFNRDIFKPYLTACEIQKKRLECAIYLQVKRYERAYAGRQADAR